ncbi:hypothetical protein [Paraburkholderia dinghuensis]|uniref:Uncharacterized protein n=1 Tax=Paraburkholderia dinghuensis TaxID=2305225 RepID=A0A3N6MKQ8_9BURK|nr:hypothetical protein [Paraburkholderia dinghuensis]RQH04369.1 hypothetical protein D1Y85_18055 [Paraburkholderia dinghuensis]
MLFRLNACISVARRSALFVVIIGLSTSWMPECRADDTAASAPAQAEPRGASVDTESGIVSLIDQKNALIVVTVPGREDLSYSAQDFPDLLNSVKVGDKLTASYLEPYVTELKPDKGAALTRLDRTAKVTQHSRGANQESFQALRTFSGVVVVTGINSKLKLLTFEDKSGTAHSIRVNRPDLVEVMQSLKRYSHVRLVYESETTVTASP